MGEKFGHSYGGITLQFMHVTKAATGLLGEVIGNVVDIEVADLYGDGIQDLYFCSARNFGSSDSARDFLLLGQ